MARNSSVVAEMNLFWLSCSCMHSILIIRKHLVLFSSSRIKWTHVDHLTANFLPWSIRVLRWWNGPWDYILVGALHDFGRSPNDTVGLGQMSEFYRAKSPQIFSILLYLNNFVLQVHFRFRDLLNDWHWNCVISYSMWVVYENHNHRVCIIEGVLINF